MTGINIYSGTRGLGGALTNPTLLAHKKGSITQAYPVLFHGVSWADAETAYQTLKGQSPFEVLEPLMADILVAKLTQHPRLLQAITTRGGVAWLERCEHRTGARTGTLKRWEGSGRASAFLRALMWAYEQVMLNLSLTRGAKEYLPHAMRRTP